jgi:hypothetical protein
MNLKGKYEVIHCSLPMTFTQALLVFPVQLRIHSAANCQLLAASAQGRIIGDALAPLFLTAAEPRLSCDQPAHNKHRGLRRRKDLCAGLTGAGIRSEISDGTL